jgi:hypothetical protein
MIVKNLKNSVMFTDIDTTENTITSNPPWVSDEENGQSLTNFLEEQGRQNKAKLQTLAEKLKTNYKEYPICKEDYTTIDSGDSRLRKNWIRHRNSRDD